MRSDHPPIEVADLIGSVPSEKIRGCWTGRAIEHRLATPADVADLDRFLPPGPKVILTGQVTYLGGVA